MLADILRDLENMRFSASMNHREQDDPTAQKGRVRFSAAAQRNNVARSPVANARRGAPTNAVGAAALAVAAVDATTAQGPRATAPVAGNQVVPFNPGNAAVLPFSAANGGVTSPTMSQMNVRGRPGASIVVKSPLKVASANNLGSGIAMGPVMTGPGGVPMTGMGSLSAQNMLALPFGDMGVMGLANGAAQQQAEAGFVSEIDPKYASIPGMPQRIVKKKVRNTGRVVCAVWHTA